MKLMINTEKTHPSLRGSGLINEEKGKVQGDRSNLCAVELRGDTRDRIKVFSLPPSDCCGGSFRLSLPEAAPSRLAMTRFFLSSQEKTHPSLRGTKRRSNLCAVAMRGDTQDRIKVFSLPPSDCRGGKLLVHSLEDALRRLAMTHM